MVLGTRNMVLTSAGFEVTAASTVTGAEQLLEARRFDLVVLCDTIPPERRYDLASKLRRKSPALRVLILYEPGEPSPKAGVADAFVGSLDGPEALIEGARQLVRG
jgi:DNA-binding response OmpR family regulator